MAREEVQAREVVPGRKEGLAREEDQRELLAMEQELFCWLTQAKFRLQIDL